METVKTTTWKEKLAYGLGGAGAQFIWTFASSFLTLYLTDSALIAAGVVGTMMLIIRIFDGISDVLMGVVIENTYTKYGKARPWFGVMIIPLAISMVLSFNVPGSFSDTGKIVYIYIMYFLMAVIFYTANFMSYNTMLSRISLDTQDQNKLSSIKNLLINVVSLALILVTNALLPALGGEKNQSTWTTISIGMGVCAVVLMTICFFGTKEKLPAVKEKKGSGDISLGEGVKALLRTKYFYIIIAIFTCAFMLIGITNSGGVYYARDVLGNSGYYGILAVVVAAFTIVGVVLTPNLMKKHGKRVAMIVAATAGAIGYGIGFLMPRSFIGVGIGLAIRSAGAGIISTGMWTLVPDLVDYLAQKTGKRLEGITTSAASVGQKIGTGFGSAVLGWSLSLGGYDGTAAVQSESVVQAEIIGWLAVPFFCMVAIAVVAAFWDIDKKKAD